MFCALLALVIAAGSSGGCIWLDDFGKFKIGDAGERELPDAQTGQSDAAAGDAATAERCRDVDCTSLDATCAKGVCDAETGECKAENIADGTACFDGNPCTFADSCSGGSCNGQLLDCSALDDECSKGMCDPETGGCAFGPNDASQPCDDANACTENDRCTDDPKNRCLGERAPAGTSCSDFNSCTGTEQEPDECGERGDELGFGCAPGAPVAAETQCNDGSECTTSDRCDGEGFCDGVSVLEGEPCHEACSANTTCRDGLCVTDDNAAPTYNNQCVFNFCGLSDLCREEWKTDLVCHCGCGYEDPACSACSAYMCQSLDAHKAARWCNDSGEPANNCPEELKNDGKCDCGCQFEDPDCNGGACCSGTGDPGCGDSYIEECVCGRQPNGDTSCCEDEWTDRCAELAVNLGCMLCP